MSTSYMSNADIPTPVIYKSITKEWILSLQSLLWACSGAGTGSEGQCHIFGIPLTNYQGMKAIIQTPTVLRPPYKRTIHGYEPLTHNSNYNSFFIYILTSSCPRSLFHSTPGLLD